MISNPATAPMIVPQPPESGVPADDGGGDDCQGEVLAGGRVNRPSEADEQCAGQPADRAHQDQRLHPYARNRNTGQPRRFRVAADSLHAVAEAGSVQHQMEDNRQRQKDDGDDRQHAADFGRDDAEKAAAGVQGTIGRDWLATSDSP